MDSSRSDVFLIIMMIAMTALPTFAYLAVRLFGAHEVASDHP